MDREAVIVASWRWQFDLLISHLKQLNGYALGGLSTGHPVIHLDLIANQNVASYATTTALLLRPPPRQRSPLPGGFPRGAGRWRRPLHRSRNRRHLSGTLPRSPPLCPCLARPTSTGVGHWPIQRQPSRKAGQGHRCRALQNWRHSKSPRILFT